jgi:hypothetical protein
MAALHDWDREDLTRIRGNITEYHRRKQAKHSVDFYPEWCGRFEVNVEQLLDLVDRLAADPATVPTGTGWPVTS